MTNSALLKACARGLAVALAAGVASTAHAGPTEQLSVLTQHPSNPDVWLLNYENGLGGLLYSTDGGKTVRIHPGMAFTESGLRDLVQPAIQADGTLLVPTRYGLYSAGTDGCIKAHPLVTVEKPAAPADSAASAVALHPSEPNVSFYLTNDISAPRTGVWRRAADGTVTELGANDGKDFDARDLRVIARAASEGGLRFVELGRKSNKLFLRISDTQAASWQEFPITVTGADGGYPRFVALVPGEPLKLVIVVEKTGNPDPLDLVLYSSDGGQNFATYAQPVTRLMQSLVTPDGRLFMADQGGNTTTSGLWMAESVGAAPTKLVDYPVHCLGYDATSQKLLLCKAYEMGQFDPASKSFCRMFQLNEVSDFVCPPSSLPTPEGASYSTARSVQDQMCGGWCGASHYASSAFCATYNVTQPACGIGARIYDNTGPEELRWVEPPGKAETRCAGFEAVANRPDASVPDASVSTPDAGVSADDAAVANDAAGDMPKKDKGDGDSCTVHVAGAQHGSLLVMAALSLVTWSRRRRKQQRV